MRSAIHHQPSGERNEPINPFIFLPLLVPALLLSLAAAGRGVLPGDIGITLFLQRHIPAETAWFFETVNWAGSSQVSAMIIVTLGLVFLALRQPVAAAMMLLTFPLRLSSSVLKVVFDSPRPTEAVVQVTEFADGLGFPSGHVVGAMLLYGMLFILAPRLTARKPLYVTIRVVTVVMMVLSGISRIYVGAHWPSDVLGGYLWGLIVLLGAVLAVQFCLLQTRIGQSRD